MYELKVITRFAAAHQLAMVGTKCDNMHGHNWKIEVYVTGEKLNTAASWWTSGRSRPIWPKL